MKSQGRTHKKQKNKREKHVQFKNALRTILNYIHKINQKR